MTCKGICEQYKAKGDGPLHYAIGNKRCQICEIFIRHEGLWCPCCGYRLRTKPRNGKLRNKLKDTILESIQHNDKPNRKEIISNGNGEFTIREVS